ncbi:hypothetical protein B0J14DRAFT_662111 [Halenospora varia]|nr:hypothetical protein B0J14DRAFT_662111 [Halenospora varia]
MHWPLLATTLVAPVTALLRFQCAQLVTQRLDPLVNPGINPSPHLHQIVGGNAFNVSMDPKLDLPKLSTCTTCQYVDDFSNYWTAVMYFKARNGTYKRVPQAGNVGFEGARGGGMTVYYLEPKTKITAFKPGFRMFVGDPLAKTKAEADKYRQLTYTCLETLNTRSPETKDFPTKPCKAGIMANMRFPTCWDGVNLDTPNHMDHMSYPSSGTFENNGPCPSTHPVKVPQVFFEVIWDTKQFNNKADWPADGSQPFVWSFGDKTGFGTHADYVFGWKGDALQKVMDSGCNVNCPVIKTQSMADMNKCAQQAVVKEEIDGWLPALPGGMQVL